MQPGSSAAPTGRYVPLGAVHPTGPTTPAILTPPTTESAAHATDAANATGQTTAGGTRTWRFSAAGAAGSPLAGMHVEVTVLAADLVRVRLRRGAGEEQPSWAVVPHAWPAVDARVNQGEDGRLEITTDALRLDIATDPFRLSASWPDGTPFAEDDAALGMGVVAPVLGQAIPETWLPLGGLRVVKRLAPGERILGAGERTAPLDRRGQRIAFYNTDPPMWPHGEKTTQMYVSLPFWMGLRDGRAYGIFLDCPAWSELDAGASEPDRMSFAVAQDELTYYLFAGPTPAEVLARYADLTGHMPLPPRWSLGYAQCRYSYFPEAEVRGVAHEFRARRIPCDSLWLDIDYMDEYRLFTWSPTRFPDPAKLTRDLGQQGFKVVTIIDPGVKIDPTDQTYREGIAGDAFVRTPQGTIYAGPVWPGMSAFPDFSRPAVRAWWGRRLAALTDVGVAGVWDDMNEPALTSIMTPGVDLPHGATLPPDTLHFPAGPEGQPLLHARFHNAYGMQMVRATYEGLLAQRPNMRPFVLTRSGYPGVQRYAAIWTGDNTSNWEHMKLAMRMCLAIGLSGAPFVGFDTGGFWGETDGEMLVRFTQIGALFPFFRNHSAIGTGAQEPWVFGPHYEHPIREAIELRYQLLPYLYTVFERASRDGSPIARPLIYAYPQEMSYATVEDEVLVGDALLAAPVTTKDTLSREVLFPPDVWRDWRTGERIVGPVRQVVKSPLDVVPLYQREGTIMPVGPVLQYSEERTPDPLTLAVCLGPEDGARAEGELYEDDGATLDYERGAWRRTRFVAERHGAKLTLTAITETGGSYEIEPRDWVVEFHLPHLDPEASRPRALLAELRAKPEMATFAHVDRRYETVVRVPLGRVAPGWTLEVTGDNFA